MQKIVTEIHLKAIRENARAFKAKTGVKLCAVVKADAYGHGAEAVAATLAGIADCFAVSLVEEAIAIRAASLGKDVLVLTPPTSAETAFTAMSYGCILTVTDLWTARLIDGVARRYGLPCKVHLKTNTGMNRYGMNASMLGKVCKFLRKSTFTRVEGIFSHLYTCDGETCEKQRQIFVKQVGVCRRYFPEVTAHLSATYGATLSKAFAFDMVRVGLGLYGYFPEGGEDASNRFPPLQKAMTAYAEISASRQISFGGVGYGAMTETKRRAGKRLSVLRVGYADGTGHAQANAATENEYPVGDFCMDACFLRGKRQRGGRVTLFEDAQTLAKKRNTIVYEVLCLTALRAERVYRNG